MIVLSIQAGLRCDPNHVPAFLGTALHGLFERALNQQCPGLLGLLARGQDKLYVIHAPAVFAPTQVLRFGVALFGEIEGHWQSVASSLSRCSFLGVGGWRGELVQPVMTVMDRSCTFRGVDSNIAGADLPSAEWLPPSSLVPTENVEMLALNFVTPLRLTTSTKRSLGAGDAPPSLRSIVSSLNRRMAYLEPGWAAAFALDDLDWAQSEAGQPVHRAEELSLVRWPHQRLAMDLYGRVGTMRWRGMFSKRLVRLLDAGQWLCAGQGTAMGQGRYELTCESN